VTSFSCNRDWTCVLLHEHLTPELYRDPDTCTIVKAANRAVRKLLVKDSTIRLGKTDALLFQVIKNTAYSIAR